MQAEICWAWTTQAKSFLLGRHLTGLGISAASRCMYFSAASRCMYFSAASRCMYFGTFDRASALSQLVSTKERREADMVSAAFCYLWGRYRSVLSGGGV